MTVFLMRTVKRGTVFLTRTVKRGTNVFFNVIGKLLAKHIFGPRKDTLVWQHEKPIFPQIYSTLYPNNLGFTNKTMTAKISAKKVGDFLSVKAAELIFV